VHLVADCDSLYKHLLHYAAAAAAVVVVVENYAEDRILTKIMRYKCHDALVKGEPKAHRNCMFMSCENGFFSSIKRI